MHVVTLFRMLYKTHSINPQISIQNIISYIIIAYMFRHTVDDISKIFHVNLNGMGTYTCNNTH
jgi:hypothetical protein